MVSTAVTGPTQTTQKQPSGNVGVSNQKDAAAARRSIGQTYDQFLKLLTTQLKNQNPLSPTDSNQFTQQLVQYSQVEQQINANEKLDVLVAQNKTAQTLQAATFLGNTIEAKSDKLVKTTATGTVDFGYTFNTKPEKITATVYDESGTKVIRTMTMPATDGPQIKTWDGKSDNGVAQPAGLYKFSVIGTTNGRVVIPESQTTVGKVTDIQLSSGGATIYIGSVGVPMSDIKSVKKI